MDVLEKALFERQRELANIEKEFIAYRREYDEKWRRLRQVTRNIRYWEKRIGTLNKRFADLRKTGWRNLKGPQRAEYQRIRGLIPLGTARQMYWTDEQTTIINEINAERDKFNYLRDSIATLRAIIRDERREYSGLKLAVDTLQEDIPRKVVEEFLGDESCSGNDIYWNPLRKEYTVRKPKTKEQLIGDLVRRDKRLGVTYTASIETGKGHDVPLTVEITTVTFVREMDSAAIADVERRLDQKTMQHMTEHGWSNLMDAFEKKGIEYNGEQHIKNIKLYPFTVPEYPMAHIYIERKSRYIPERKYEQDISLV